MNSNMDRKNQWDRERMNQITWNFGKQNGMLGSTNPQSFIKIGYAVQKWKQNKMRDR